MSRQHEIRQCQSTKHRLQNRSAKSAVLSGKKLTVRKFVWLGRRYCLSVKFFESGWAIDNLIMKVWSYVNPVHLLHQHSKLYSCNVTNRCCSYSRSLSHRFDTWIPTRFGLSMVLHFMVPLLFNACLLTLACLLHVDRSQISNSLLNRNRLVRAPMYLARNFSRKFFHPPYSEQMS